MPAAGRVAADWTRLQPRVPRAWWTLAFLFDRQQLYDSARVAERNAERLASDGSSSAVPIAMRAIRSGQFADADRLLKDQTQNGNPAERGDALWWLVISLRNQGRLHDALAIAEQLVRNSRAVQPAFSTPTSLDAVAVAQVQFEMGHFRRAAALFDSIGDYDWNFSPDFRREAPGLYARHRIWMTMHVATSHAAAGDTAQLGSIADSIGVWKRLSAMSRDQLLDHYVRGLLLRARGQLPAAEQEFRHALDAPIDGYSRVNLQLASVLVAEGRPADAIPVLRAPLHGPIEAASYYLTGTDIHAELGDAFDRAGEPDSALAHYQYVLAAWRHADPEFRPRIDAIERRVRSLGQRVGRRAVADTRIH
jgi:tetratricopeptide (TPR) repeat protein